MTYWNISKTKLPIVIHREGDFVTLNEGDFWSDGVGRLYVWIPGDSLGGRYVWKELSRAEADVIWSWYKNQQSWQPISDEECEYLRDSLGLDPDAEI